MDEGLLSHHPLSRPYNVYVLILDKNTNRMGTAATKKYEDLLLVSLFFAMFLY